MSVAVADAALLARLTEVYAEEHDLCLNALGAMSDIAADASWCIGGVNDASPDLVLYVKRPEARDVLERNQRRAVAEVWMWTGVRLEIWSLRGAAYTREPTSRIVPVDPAELAARMRPENTARQTDVVREFRRALRRRK